MGVVIVNTVFYSVVEEEKERNLERQETYLNEIKKLPKGFLVTKKRGNKTYFYLQFWNGEKNVSKYIKNDTNIDEIKNQIAERKHLEGIMKRLKLEYKQMCKVVRE